ncbi:hypothetical protein SedNR2807_01660 [Citrobacter sedlakii]
MSIASLKKIALISIDPRGGIFRIPTGKMQIFPLQQTIIQHIVTPYGKISDNPPKEGCLLNPAS